MCYQSNSDGGLRVCVDLADLAEYARRWLALEAYAQTKYPMYLNGSQFTLYHAKYAFDAMMKEAGYVVEEQP